MAEFKFIELYQTRDFSKKLNASFEFFFQNFKPIVLSILVIAGPSVLIAALLIGSFVGDAIKFSSPSMIQSPEAAQAYFLSVSFWIQILFMIVLLLLASVMSVSTVNNYILLYGEKRTNKISIAEVWERVKGSLGMYLGTTLIFGLGGMTLYILVVVPGSFLVMAGPTGVALFMLYFMLVIIGMFYVMINCSMTYLVRSVDKLGFIEAVKRSFYLIRGKWWSTFGITIVLQMVVSSIASLLILPFYFFIIIWAVTHADAGSFEEIFSFLQVVIPIFIAFIQMIQLLLNSLPNVGIAFQYFNLVERKESRSLIQSIDTIGEKDQTGYMEKPSEEHDQY
jgi:hypothetical protein